MAGRHENCLCGYSLIGQQVTPIIEKTGAKNRGKLIEEAKFEQGEFLGAQFND